jgi:uncharacterized protein (TIGR03435 family)
MRADARARMLAWVCWNGDSQRAPFGIFCTSSLRAQAPSADKALSFAAASIKPIVGTAGRFRSEPGLRVLPNGFMSAAAGVTARQLIVEAYQLTPFQIVGGPNWIDSDRFAIEARASGPVNAEAIRLMLHTLLFERFSLRNRFSGRNMQTYALTLSKGGQSLTRYQVKPDADRPTSSGFQRAGSAISGHTGGRAVTFDATSMESFARSLSLLTGAQHGSSLLGRPVLDKTGLQGQYSFQLAWNEDDDFMTALQDELGLRLESQTAEVMTLVISNIEKPSAD